MRNHGDWKTLNFVIMTSTSSQDCSLAAQESHFKCVSGRNRELAWSKMASCWEFSAGMCIVQWQQQQQHKMQRGASSNMSAVPAPCVWTVCLLCRIMGNHKSTPGCQCLSPKHKAHPAELRYVHLSVVLHPAVVGVNSVWCYLWVTSQWNRLPHKRPVMNLCFLHCTCIKIITV